MTCFLLTEAHSNSYEPENECLYNCIVTIGSISSRHSPDEKNSIIIHHAPSFVTEKKTPSKNCSIF